MNCDHLLFSDYSNYPINPTLTSTVKAVKIAKITFIDALTGSTSLKSTIAENTQKQNRRTKANVITVLISQCPFLNLYYIPLFQPFVSKITIYKAGC